MNTEKINPSSIVFDIQRFSIHDGPGIRTLIFFKGCSLRCAWCQNPESIKPRPEIAFYAEYCIGCGNCIKTCCEEAITMKADQRILWDKCTACGLCTRECPANALRLVGAEYSISKLLQESLLDKDFFDVSNGGISLSGGEPVLHSKFLFAFLPELKKHKVNVLLETAGNYPFSMLEPLLPYIDHIYFDYKLPDDQAYRNYTGKGNHQIINVLHILSDKGFPLTVRIPVIPGINTDPVQIRLICDMLHSLTIKDVHLLKYNHLWEAKISRLDTQQNILHTSAESVNYDKIMDTFYEHGIKAMMTE
jgi:glycyl-radical enzyme activating protein